MKRHPDVKLLASELLFSGRIFELRRERLRLPSGLEQDLAVIDHPGAVAIAAELDDGRLILVRQYRHAVGDWLVELPAGRLEPGEAPLVAAQRELEEETGARARQWTLLARFYPAPGFCSECMHVFHARDIEWVQGERRPHDHDEEFELVLRTPAELCAAPPADAKTWLAASLLDRRPDRIQRTGDAHP
ncbi:MAG: NUDIX hydrolase [Planctomycetes bacterium]|nr:NUDIX hydrolase [Planctomycetota bacterium]